VPLVSPLSADTRSVLADWLELVALTQPRALATRADITHLLDFLGENEHDSYPEVATGDELETEILEEGSHGIAESVFEELEFRSSVLKDRYPFVLEYRGAQWSLRFRPISTNACVGARACYIFCLLSSAVRDHRIDGDGEGLKNLKAQLPRHFETLSSAIAAEIVNGRSFQLGWPRTDGSCFRNALERLCREIGTGRPIEHEPPWSQGREKDSGIDIVAWREFADFGPGKLVLLGQVASGNNWEEKSVKTAVPNFNSWFSEALTEHYVPAIFVPFPQHHKCQGKLNNSFSNVAKAEAWRRERNFGLVIDRLRIVELANDRLFEIEGAANLPIGQTIENWNGEILAIAKAAQ
jgi:hypothetical protein